MLKKSQSILEYIIVVSAIVVAVLAAAENLIKPAVNKMFTDSSNIIETSTGKLSNLVGK